MESNGHDLRGIEEVQARLVRGRAQLSARGRSQLRRGAPVGTPPNRQGPTTNLLVLLSYAQPNKLQYTVPYEKLSFPSFVYLVPYILIRS